MSTRILLPVDGSDNAARAVEHVVRLAGKGEPPQVCLLNVQPTLRPHAGTSAIVSQQMIDEYLDEQAQAALAPARARLQAAGIAFTEHTARGHIATRIAEHVQSLGCDAVVMGTRGTGPLKGMVLGSVAPQVICLVDVPVTLIK